MIRLIVFLILLSPLSAISQNFIGKSKSTVKKELQKQIVKNDSLVITLTDNDSALVFSYRDSKVKPVDFIYGFDRNKKCVSEKVIANCDTCFRKYFDYVLGQKKFEWRKINGNQYVSRYADRLLLEVPPDNKDYIFTILRTDWTKELYNMLSGN